MKRLLAVFIHHLFLGLTAVLMMKQTLVMSGHYAMYSLKYCVVFISTILIYQLAVAGLAFPFKKGLFYRSNVWMLTMLALFSAHLYLFSKLLPEEQMLLIFIVLLCLAYATTVGNWKGLRSIPAIKGLLLALVWSMVTVVFPLLPVWNRSEHFIILLQRFLFMLGICIIYNLRDVEADLKHGVVTIASMAGEKNTRLIAASCLLLFVITVFFSQNNPHLITALLLSAAITGIAVSRAKINGSVFYYRYIIDGCMMMQSLLVLLFLS